MSSRPLSQRSYGGIDCVASSLDQRRQRVHVVALERVDVAREQLAVRLVERPAGVGGARRRPPSSVARARWSALFTEATLVSSSSATSAAFQRSTSHRISTARWRGGRCWSAATNASRIVSRATATSAGSPSGTTSAVGNRLDPRRPPAACSGCDASGSRAGPEVHRAGAPLAAVRACRGTRSSRSGRATSAAPTRPSNRSRRATRGAASPGRRPRPRTASRASGSSTPVSSERCCSSRRSSSPAAGLAVRAIPARRSSYAPEATRRWLPGRRGRRVDRRHRIVSSRLDPLAAVRPDGRRKLIAPAGPWPGAILRARRPEERCCTTTARTRAPGPPACPRIRRSSRPAAERRRPARSRRGRPLGPVHLTVADLERSLAYYRDAVGLDVARAGRRTRLARRRRTRAARAGRGARRAARRSAYTGLYHFALLAPRARRSRPLARARRARPRPARRPLRPLRQRGDLPQRPGRARDRDLLGPAARALGRAGVERG